MHRQFLFDLVFDTRCSCCVRLALIVGAIGWAFLLVDAWRIGQPLTLSMPHRRAVIGVNGAFCLFVASALLFGSHLVGVQRDFVQTMFGRRRGRATATTAATTCCCSAATPAPTAGACVRTR